MTADREKACEKKIKTAELKLNKILNKIDSLKLNNYFISSLDLPNNKRLINLFYLNFGLKKYIVLVLILFVPVVIWWFYSEAMITVSLLLSFYLSLVYKKRWGNAEICSENNVKKIDDFIFKYHANFPKELHSSHVSEPTAHFF